MQTYGDREPDREPGATEETGLTTEDIMQSGTEGEQETPMYPGEATSSQADDAQAGEADESVADESVAAESTAAESTEGDDEPLLGTTETEEYHKAWTDIQGRFVDDPQDAVRSADTLVAEVMQALAGTFSERKQGLEGQWGRGEQVATEDLRVALQQYRSFFNRLLKT